MRRIILAATLVWCFQIVVSSAQPNVLLIISDDQAWTDYSFMGHPDIRTPNLDRLASESAVFRHGYVPTALCRPSLMSLITGQYAHRHGVTGNDPSPKYAPRGSDLAIKRRAQLISKIDQWQTLPSLLHEKGYFSHQSGKWWEGSFKRGGFTHGMTRGFPNPGGRHGDEGLKIGREGLQPCKDFIDQMIKQDAPFFMWYAPFMPHTPHKPPHRIVKKYMDHHPVSIANYYAMCEWFDETCGSLIGYLETKKIRDNTLIIYVGDNGWIQDPENRGYAPRSKQTPYEAGVRQPVLFSWPSKIRPQERQERISSIDLFPTILEATGARSVPSPGINLLDHLIEETRIDREAVFGEGFAHDIADLEDPEATLLYRWCVENQWKLLLTYDGEVNRYQTTHPRTEKRPQLFDLARDPHECRNLASRHPDIVEAMVKKIDAWYPVVRRNVQKVY